MPTPAMRTHLAELFDAGNKHAQQEKYDNACELYTDCVQNDPGNLQYLQNLMTTLHKKYGGVKKLDFMAQFKKLGARTALKKAVSQCDWDEAIQQGISVLLVNPWDGPTLMAMGTACERIMDEEGASAVVTYGDCGLYYLKCAFDTFPKDKPDLEVCRQLTEALAKRDRFVEAITFWRKCDGTEGESDDPPAGSGVFARIKPRPSGGSASREPEPDIDK